MGFPQPPKLSLGVADLCALDSVPEVHPLCRRLVCADLGSRRALRVAGLLWPCFGSLCLPSVLRGLCALASPHSVAEVICFSFSCAGRAVLLPKFACLPSMTPQARNLRRLCLSARSHSATWASPLCCKGCVHWLGLYAHHSRFCEPAMFGATVHEL